MDKTLFDKAVDNLNAAITLYNSDSDDEGFLNIMAYHLQQGVEFAIKYILEMNGVEYPKTHDIEQLILLAKDNKVDLKLTDYIEDHAEMFSQWEAKSRYVLGYHVEKKKVERAIKGVDEYLKSIIEE